MVSSKAMIHIQVRNARIAEGLSQVQLAKKAGVGRTQLRDLEAGGNVTLETLGKIVSALPSMKVLSFGDVELLPRGVRAADVLASARATVAQLQDLIARLEAMSAVPPAVSSDEVTSEEAERLDRMVDEIERAPLHSGTPAKGSV